MLTETPKPIKAKSCTNDYVNKVAKGAYKEGGFGRGRVSPVTIRVKLATIWRAFFFDFLLGLTCSSNQNQSVDHFILYTNRHDSVRGCAFWGSITNTWQPPHGSNRSSQNPHFWIGNMLFLLRTPRDHPVWNWCPTRLHTVSLSCTIAIQTL